MRGSLVALVALFSIAGVRAEDCGNPFDSPGRFGPFDYRDPTKNAERNIVEIHHFTPYMEEMALYGFSSRQPTIPEEVAGQQLVAGNFDYTLHAFPNHYRALYAMGTWQLKLREKSQSEYDATRQAWHFWSAECYFERALMYVPNDGLVYHAYGAFLQKAGQLKKAEQQYKRAVELLPENPEPHYNLGLLYADLGDYAKASEQASIAYGLGYPLQGLKRKLARMQGQSRGAGTESAPKGSAP